jgi:hypothetical protein
MTSRSAFTEPKGPFTETVSAIETNEELSAADQAHESLVTMKAVRRKSSG